MKNLQGDVVSIVDKLGVIVVEYTYDAWGKLLTTTGTLASTIGTYNPFRYRGYYYDSETGWYYLQSRYYDSIVGRFLNADGYASTGQGLLGNNMFVYCGNNSINFKDPYGTKSVLTNAPSCDDYIMDIIDEEDLGATTDSYIGEKQTGDYIEHSFKSKPTIKFNKFLFWSWTSTTYTIAKYYFEKIDTRVYKEKYEQYKAYIQWTYFGEDFVNAWGLVDPGTYLSKKMLKKVLWTQNVSTTVAPTMFDYIREKIDSYNTSERYKLHHVLVITYVDGEILSTETLWPDN